MTARDIIAAMWREQRGLDAFTTFSACDRGCGRLARRGVCFGCLTVDLGTRIDHPGEARALATTMELARVCTRVVLEREAAKHGD